MRLSSKLNSSLWLHHTGHSDKYSSVLGLKNRKSSIETKLLLDDVKMELSSAAEPAPPSSALLSLTAVNISMQLDLLTKASYLWGKAIITAPILQLKRLKDCTKSLLEELQQNSVLSYGRSKSHPPKRTPFQNECVKSMYLAILSITTYQTNIPHFLYRDWNLIQESWLPGSYCYLANGYVIHQQNALSEVQEVCGMNSRCSVPTATIQGSLWYYLRKFLEGSPPAIFPIKLRLQLNYWLKSYLASSLKSTKKSGWPENWYEALRRTDR